MGRVNCAVVERELEKARSERGVGSMEQMQLLIAMSLQVQLEILDALDDILQTVSGVPVGRESKQ